MKARRYMGRLMMEDRRVRINVSWRREYAPRAGWSRFASAWGALLLPSQPGGPGARADRKAGWKIRAGADGRSAHVRAGRLGGVPPFGRSHAPGRKPRKAPWRPAWPSRRIAGRRFPELGPPGPTDADPQARCA